MCGRFSLGLPRHQIQQLPGYNDVHVREWVNEDRFVPRYNIAPRSHAPVLRQAGDGVHGPSNRSYVLHTMRWGLIPHWSKHEDKTLSTTNARSENLTQGGGMWASIKGKKRCVVVCEGYYEWLTKGKDKIPHFTKNKDGRIMLLAGLYDSVVLEGETEPMWTFAIVTTAANKEFEWLHERQPVILPSLEVVDRWLDTSTQSWTSELTKLVEPYHAPSAPLECYQVPKEVGKVGSESPTFIKPVSQRKDGIEAMFSKQKKEQHSGARKRPRSASPVTDHPYQSLSAESLATTESPTKRLKEANAKLRDEDYEVVCLDQDPSEPEDRPEINKNTSKRSSSSHTQSFKSSPSPRKAARKATKTNGSAKITNFFSKS